MADVCVSDLDFVVIGGQLRLNPIYVQTSAGTFNHLLDGVNLVWEEIGEMPSLTIPEDGLYVVTMDARGVAILNEESNASVAQCFGAIARNDVLVSGTETMLTMLSRGDPTALEPALQVQGTGSCTRVMDLVADDVLKLWGARSADPGTVTNIQSAPTTGRCRLTARRIGG